MNYKYIRNATSAVRAIESLMANPWLGVDIETTPKEKFKGIKGAALNPQTADIRLLQVAGKDSAYVFDMATLSPEVFKQLADKPWIAHNAKFEYAHLKNAGFEIPRLHDSMLLDRLVNHKTRKLSEVAKSVISLDMDKTMQVSDWSGDLSKEQLEYAALDAIAPYQIGSKLHPLMCKQGQLGLYDLWVDNLPILGDMYLQGQVFNWQQHEGLVEQWQQQLEQLQAELKLHIGDINPRSGTQLGEWLKANLDSKTLSKWATTPKGKLKTDADTFSLFADLPVIQPLLKYKAVAKLISTYADGYSKHKSPLTSRLHTEFILGSTRTGRLAARNPNSQNPPRLPTFRACYTAQQNNVLLGNDYGQIELRVAAYLSQDTNMLNAYYRGDDLHKKTAQAVSGCSQVTADQRQGAKCLNFGSLFGMYAKTMARNAKLQYGVDMTPKAAREALSKFSEAYPQLDTWRALQAATATVNRQVVTSMGLIRNFRAVPAGYEAGEATNVPVQGTAAEILLQATRILAPKLKSLGARMTNLIHDEIIVDAPADNKAEVGKLISESMVEGFLKVIPDERLTRDLVETKTGRTWADVH